MYCHVIMPVGADAEATEKQALISRIAEKNKLHVHFPDYIPHAPIFILEKAVKDIQGAAFILADLSLERPSCYYELGLAQALGKRIHLIASTGTDIHQTADREKVSFFTNLTEFERLLSIILANWK